MSEKTEQPTAKKLREAREKGEVAKSKDFTQTVLVVALFAYMLASGSRLVDKLGQLVLLPFAYLHHDFDAAINNLLDEFFSEAVALTLPFLLIVLILGIFVEALQTGLLISFKSLMPSAKKLNVAANAKNMFSKKNLVEFLKSLLKIGIITWVLYDLILRQLPTLMLLPYKDIPVLGAVFGEILKTLIIYTGLAYVVLSLADLLWQRHQYTKGLMMSKDEVKQEYKEMEGDPHIKHQRKHLHQEMMQHGAVESSRKATVVVTNPTHFAVALKYDRDMAAPICVAKGVDAVALKIRAIATEHDVPVVENPPLARALYASVDVDETIPAEHFKAVAQVIGFVMQRRKKR